MKNYLTILLITLTTFCFTNINAQDIDNGKINIGTLDSVQSNILNENRRIWVHVPTTATNSDTKYPVIYLLDGDGHFTSVVGMTRQLSTTNGNTVVPKMIVVGIPNTFRTRDLTPTQIEGDSGPNASGGGEKFMDFIEKELIPYIDANYPTTKYRTYIGHSLGGLTTINTLLERPQLFSNYIALDPSLWWDNQAVLNKAKTSLNSKKLSNKSLFVGIANTMSPEMDINTVSQDTTRNTQHIRAILEFSKQVAPQSSSGLNFDYKYYNDDDHGSVPLIAEYDAFRFLFSWYNVNDIMPIIFNEESSLESILTSIKEHYSKTSEKFGYKQFPDEAFINQLGYGFMGQQKNEKALAFFNMNVENFPHSTNVYDSLGDYYASVNENEKAIEAYAKAMSTGGGNSYSQQKLDDLKKEK